MNLETIKTGLFKKYLNWKYRTGKLRRYINKISRDLAREGINNREDQSEVKVAAFQVKMNLYNNPLDFIDKMNSLVYEAVKEGAELLVFPENNLIQLLGILPGIGDQQGSDEESSGIDEILAELGGNITITDILAFIGPVIKKIAITTFSELSRNYQVYIMTGTGMFPGSDGNIYNSGLLIGPDGRIIGQQEKAHLLPIESEWGIKTGDKLGVFETRLGKLAFPVCMDATYFESFRILANKGAEIVIIPIANPDPDYNYWTALRGIWGRVQESKVYGIKSAMVGDFLGFTFTGQAGIYAPLEMTADRSGIIVEASTPDQEEVVIAGLNLEQLQKFRASCKYPNNKTLWENYFPQVYYSVRL